MINLNEMIEYQEEMHGRSSTEVFMRLLHDVWHIVEVLNESPTGICTCRSTGHGLVFEIDVDDLIPV